MSRNFIYLRPPEIALFTMCKTPYPHLPHIKWQSKRSICRYSVLIGLNIHKVGHYEQHYVIKEYINKGKRN